jgi:uncharacterized protein (PEP-CTERM system associated)
MEWGGLVVLLRIPWDSENGVSKTMGMARCLGAICVAATLFAPGAVLADEWRIKPSVSAFESFTSNAGLDPPGKEKFDFATTISPAIDIHREAPRLALDLNYTLNAIIYARNENLDEVQHQLRFDSRAVVVPEMLFLDANAAIAQEPRKSERPSSGSDLTASTNLTSVYTYRISPSLQNHFGTFADSGLRYTFGQVFSSGLPDSTVQSLDGSLVSGSRFTRMLWALNASGAFTTGSRNVSDIFAAINAEYPIDRHVSLLGSAGYERISDSTLDDEPDGPIGTAGLRLNPGPRTSLEVLYNHRFDSDFATGKASYLIDTQSRVEASYSERVETSQVAFVNNLDFLRRDEFGNFIDSRTDRLFHLGDTNFGLEDNAFRLRTFNLSLHLVRGRSTWDAIAYHERRDIDALDEQDTAIGGSLSWGYRLSEETTVDLTARYRHETLDTSSGNDHLQLIGAGVSLVEKLNENLDAVFAVNYTKQLTKRSDDEFTEAVVSMGLVKRF